MPSYKTALATLTLIIGLVIVLPMLSASTLPFPTRGVVRAQEMESHANDVGSRLSSQQAPAAPAKYTVHLPFVTGSRPVKNPLVATPTVTSGSAPALLAADRFGRVVANGWGSADMGGEIALLEGSPEAFHVDGDVGTIELTTPGTGRVALLPNVSVLESDILFKVGTDKVATGGGQYAYFVVRQQTFGTAYRGRIRFTSSGSVGLQAMYATEGVETLLGSEHIVPNLNHMPNSFIWIRGRVTGVAPTTIEMKAWASEETEPSSWQYVVIDGEPDLQGVGAVGLRAYVSASSTNGATTFWFDDLHVTEPHQGSREIEESIATPTDTGTASPPLTDTPTPAGEPPSTPTGAPTSIALPTSTQAPTSTPSLPPTSTPAVTIPPTSTPTPPIMLDPTPGTFSGDLTIKDTNYAIPSGAFFVAPTGNDGNAGSQAAPWRTLAKAVAAAPSGSTIVLRTGTYYESVTVSGKALTLQPFPHEQAWLKGSEVVTDWVADGAFWRKDGWTYKFAHDLPANDQRYIDPNYPYAHYPDMVFMNGARLAQVGSLTELAPNKFYVDYASDRLYLGSDPNGQTVEAATKTQALVINTPGSTIRGLGFMHYATHRDQFGMVKGASGGLTFENNTIAWSAAQGLFVKSDTRVRGNIISYNGISGIAASSAHNSVFENNIIMYNNQEHFSNWENGGIKFALSMNTVFRGNEVAHNLGKGIWGDVSNHNATVVNNRVHDNASHGIMYEISAKGIIANNLVFRNGGHGIYVLESSEVDVYNNTIVRSGLRDIQVSENNRVNTNSRELALGITWQTLNVTIKNNILSSTDGSHALIGVQDHKTDRTQRISAVEMQVVANYNAYYREIVTSPQHIAIWSNGASGEPSYSTFATFRGSTGHEVDGRIIENTPINPFFVDEAAGDYRQRAGSPAIAPAAPLPQAVADALGVAAGVPVQMGVLSEVR